MLRAQAIDFEKWLIKYHPLVFSEWETEASHLMDLDEWVEGDHSELTDLSYLIEDFEDWLVLEEEGRDHYECLEE